jgi:SAM-dependent methyltransferase
VQANTGSDVHGYAVHPGDPLLELAESRHYNAWIFDRARPYLGSRVLDVGAGLGVFTELAADTGADVVAVEPHGEFLDLLRERVGPRPNVRVQEGTAEALPDRARFDSLLCLNVLEHVAADADAIAGFRDRLVPGGHLLLLVPAHPALYGAYDRSVGHERRYTKGALRRLLAGAGFERVELRYVNPVGAAGWLVRVRLRRTPDWPKGSFRTFDRLVPVLRPLDRLRLPFGLSLWAVARRPRESRAG